MPRGGLLAEIRNPAQLVVGAFTAFILFGTGLLWLPFSADGPGRIGLEDALFTSTSAVTVTGLASTDISRFSLFGEVVIMILIQVGGFGIMTIGSVLAIVASHRVGLRQRMLAQAEIGSHSRPVPKRMKAVNAPTTSWAGFRISASTPPRGTERA